MASKIIRVKREGFSSETLQLRTTAPLHTQLADAVGLPPLFAFRMVDENGKDVLEAFEALEAGREYTIYPYHVEPEKQAVGTWMKSAISCCPCLAFLCR
ncbi:unnamed protein product [Durusdinium trenchii]|uniref:Uncharacterized protein n=1 Tax=Durusdinium trenchii TaxID=1381693 RepID=A0ABP0L496_9DINO